jgi:hypothetical protein
MAIRLSASDIADKVLELSEQFNNYIFENPQVLDQIPAQAALVFLDEDDPDFNEANMELAEAIPLPADVQRVFVRMKRQVRVIQQIVWEAEIVPN